MRLGRLFAAVLSAVALLSLAFPIAAQETTQRTILVLDGSGSMWGQVEGRSKIEIAREVIGGLLEDWDPRIELGITAYGHRRKGDCEDIEALVPVGRVDAGRVTAVVNGIKPKGKTPLSEAVRRAAEALRYTEEKATVILVSDGLETCNADPCAVARELEANGVEFTVHVVGFDIGEEERAQLQCLAENTGGRFLLAQNASELNEAMVETVQMVAEPEPEPEPAVEPGLKVVTVLMEGAEPLTEDLSYEVYEAKKDSQGKRKRVSHTYNAQPLFELSAGKYYVSVKHGSATADAEVEVPAGELVELTLVLGAGYLKLASIASDGGESLTGDLSYEVYEAKKNLQGKRKLVSFSYNSEPLFRLSAGKYYVYVKHGSATADAEVEVAAGELTETTLNLNAGYLRLASIASQGGEPLSGDLSYEVYEAKKNLQGKRKRVSFSYNSEPLFKLSGGKYYVFVKHGSATADAEVEVAAGELAEMTLNLNAGYLKLASIASDGGEPLSGNLSYEVYEAKKNLQGKRKRVSHSYNSEPLFKLSAGRYFITVERGEARAEAEVEVTAGELAEATLRLSGN